MNSNGGVVEEDSSDEEPLAKKKKKERRACNTTKKKETSATNKTCQKLKLMQNKLKRIERKGNANQVVHHFRGKHEQQLPKFSKILKKVLVFKKYLRQLLALITY